MRIIWLPRPFRHVVWAFVLSLCVGELISQDYRPGSPFITHYPKTAYQAGTQNWTLLQDDQDIMYIGNNHGLLVFDGENWDTYPLPNHTNVKSLAFDQRGRLFVGGQGDWGYFAGNEKGELSYQSLLPFFPEKKRAFDDVWDMFSSEGGIIGVAQNRIMRWDGQKLDFLEADAESRFDNAFQLGDKIYVHDWQKGLMELTASFTLAAMEDGDKLRLVSLAAILPSKAGEMVVVTAQKGLLYYDGKQFTAGRGATQDFLEENHAYCAIPLHDGHYAFGSPHNGLLISNRAGKIIWHINKEQGLSNNTVLSLCQDRQGHIWLGLDNGLNYVEINSPFSIMGPTEGVEGTGYASALYQGKVYLGTNQGVFSHEWPAREAIKFNPITAFSGQVWSFSNWQDSLWVGLHEGAFVWQNNEKKQLSNAEGAWKFLPLRHHPGFAVGGTYDGLVRYRNQNGKWIAEGRIPGFSESSRIMEEDREGNIWVTHFYRGVFKLSLSKDLQKIEKTESFDTSQGLPSSFSVNVCHVYDELLFTTLKGIFRYLPTENRFEPYLVLDTVFEKASPRWLWEAPNGNVWFSAGEEFGYLEVDNKGLKYQLNKVTLNRLQPFLVEGFEHVSFLDEHNVIVATESGFVHYNPSFESGIDHPQQVHIRTLRDLAADSLIYSGSPLTTDSENSSWALSSRIHALRFAFAATQFSETANTQYRYQLKGFDDKWSAWDEKTEKDYTNLPFGKYEFQVQARNDLGTASNISSLPFRIESPWFLRPLAQVIWALLFLGALVFAYFLNKRRMAQKAQAMIRNSQAEMEKKEAAFQQTLEKNEAEILHLRNEKLSSEIDYKKQELASITMHLLQKSEILFNIKKELSRLSKKLPENQKGEVKQIIKTIEKDVKMGENWDSFEHHFDRVHEDFIKRLREQFPQLTPKDLKLAAYLRMNLVTKEIAPLLNISVRGVEISRYRLRKKMELDRDINLVEYMMNF